MGWRSWSARARAGFRATRLQLSAARSARARAGSWVGEAGVPALARAFAPPGCSSPPLGVPALARAHGLAKLECPRSRGLLGWGSWNARARAGSLLGKLAAQIWVVGSVGVASAPVGLKRFGRLTAPKTLDPALRCGWRADIGPEGDLPGRGASRPVAGVGVSSWEPALDATLTRSRLPCRGGGEGSSSRYENLDSALRPGAEAQAVVAVPVREPVFCSPPRGGGPKAVVVVPGREPGFCSPPRGGSPGWRAPSSRYENLDSAFRPGAEVPAAVVVPGRLIVWALNCSVPGRKSRLAGTVVPVREPGFCSPPRGGSPGSCRRPGTTNCMGVELLRPGAEVHASVVVPGRLIGCLFHGSAPGRKLRRPSSSRDDKLYGRPIAPPRGGSPGRPFVQGRPMTWAFDGPAPGRKPRRARRPGTANWLGV